MEKKSERGKRAAIAAVLAVAAITVCLGSGEAQAQGRPVRRYRPVPARNLQMEGELAARIALLNQLVARAGREAPVQLPGARRTYLPGQIPTTVSSSIPLSGPRTPAERILFDTMNGRVTGAATAACEAGRAAQPSSIYRPGHINDGWYNRPIGPVMRSCN